MSDDVSEAAGGEGAEAERERAVAAAAIEWLAAEAPDDPLAAPGEGVATAHRPDGAPDPLARLYAEVLGLVAHELPPVPPRPALRAQVLAAARGEDRRASVSPFPLRVAKPAAPAADRPAPLPRWLVALAAALALAAVGLGATTATLLHRLDLREATLARLADELEESRRRAELLAHAQGAAERRSLSLATQLALVANPGVEVCPLGPTGARPLHPEARGLLFLSMADQQWYVRVANLEPAPPGRVYRLWFLTAGGGAMPAGELLPGPDDGISLGGRRLPDPAVMNGAAITLERLGESPHRPTGPMVLFGDEKMTIL